MKIVKTILMMIIALALICNTAQAQANRRLQDAARRLNESSTNTVPNSQQTGNTTTELSGIWESHAWTCCDRNEGQHGGWVGPGKLELSGNSFTLTYSSGYPPDDRYVPERIRKGKFSISDGKIEFVLDNGNTLVYPFSRNENVIMIDNRQRFTKKQ